jgi:transposase
MLYTSHVTTTYASNVTDAEWAMIEPLLPPRKRTCPPRWHKRQIMDGIFYQLKHQCHWADLPKDLPPPGTVFWYFNQWRREGVIEKIMTVLEAPAHSPAYPQDHPRVEQLNRYRLSA